jgi:hypothetical protein
MVYEINPCKACWKKNQQDGGGINDLNNCLVETAAAFSSYPSTNDIRSTNAAVNWNECITKKMATMGRAPCNFQLNMAPVFVQTPHTFPSRLYEFNDKDKALIHALKDCKDTKYPETCKINCQIDYDAVMDSPENSIVHSAPLARGIPNCVDWVETYEPPPPPPTDMEYTYNDIAKDRPVIFWVSFAIFGLILSYFIVIFLYMINVKMNKK